MSVPTMCQANNTKHGWNTYLTTPKPFIFKICFNHSNFCYGELLLLSFTFQIILPSRSNQKIIFWNDKNLPGTRMQQHYLMKWNNEHLKDHLTKNLVATIPSRQVGN